MRHTEVLRARCGGARRPGSRDVPRGSCRGRRCTIVTGDRSRPSPTAMRPVPARASTRLVRAGPRPALYIPIRRRRCARDAPARAHCACTGCGDRQGRARKVAGQCPHALVLLRGGGRCAPSVRPSESRGSASAPPHFSASVKVDRHFPARWRPRGHPRLDVRALARRSSLTRARAHHRGRAPLCATSTSRDVTSVAGRAYVRIPNGNRARRGADSEFEPRLEFKKTRSDAAGA